MITITREQFSQLRKRHPDQISKCIIPHEHDGKRCNPGDWTAIEGAVTGDYHNGCTLIFQHIHFEIV